MPVKIRERTYFRTAETCQLAGIARSTLLRWLRIGIIPDASYRDVRGWRLFTEADINKIIDKASSIECRDKRIH